MEISKSISARVKEALINEQKFKENISSFTLKFKNEMIEKEFIDSRTVERNPPFWIRVILLSLVFLIPCRRLMLLIFALVKVKSMTSDVDAEILSCCILAFMAILEVLSRSFEFMDIIKGCPLLLFTFYTVSFTSYSYITFKPAIVPM